MASASDKAKKAKQKAYGKKTDYFDKPSKGEVGERVTSTGWEKAKALEKAKKTKIKNATKKEVYQAYESDEKNLVKSTAKARYSNVDSDAYDLLMKRAQAAGMSASQTKKAISQALKSTARQIGTERSRTATRATGIAKREAKKKMNKFISGY
jgi:acetoin utilization deacetylase AcuC-like enzyme